MKGIVVKIPIGRKDNVIKSWIDLIIQQGGNFSRSVDYAISYYAKTGEYLHLGNIASVTTAEKASAKNIYFSQNSPAVAWLAERKRDGEKEATAIKRILRRCLTQDEDSLDQITGLDDLYDKIQEAGGFRNSTQIALDENKNEEKPRYSEKTTLDAKRNVQEIHKERSSNEYEDDNLTASFLEGMTLLR